jgi:hypothetical protein
MSRTDLDATGLRSTWVINPPLTAWPTDDDLAEIVDAYDPSILLPTTRPSNHSRRLVSFIEDVPAVCIGMATKPDEIAEAIRWSPHFSSTPCS